MHSTEVLETSKATNPLKALLGYGQSLWLDYIRRDLFTSGKLKKMIENDGLRGMTSNPSIFEKAIADSSLYDDMLHALASRSDLSTTARYEQIALRDIQDAADILRAVYEESKFRDGYVSLEVSPLLALETQKTHRGSASAVEGSQSRERDDQGSRDGAGDSGNPPTNRRRNQYQRDFAVRAGSVRRGCRNLHRRA